MVSTSNRKKSVIQAHTATGRYCSDECEIVGSCGDRIYQEELEVCDPSVGTVRGCRDDCNPKTGFTCADNQCVASGLPWDLRFGDMNRNDLETYCSWLIGITGEGARIPCGERLVTVGTVESCLRRYPVNYGVFECSVGEIEDWLGEARICIVFQEDPPCATSTSCRRRCTGGTCEPGDWLTICPASFRMGSPNTELGSFTNEIYGDVTISRDFEILTTEVTQEDFQELMGYNPSYHRGDASIFPVNNVTWHEAAAYCNELSIQNGWEVCYYCTGLRENVRCELSIVYASPYDCPGYRLPTEAEWERAARAGVTTATYNGDLIDIECSPSVLDSIAWTVCNSGDDAHEVAQLEPNPWGLYDMLGNLWEWTHDWYDESRAVETDPFGPEIGTERILRGGSYHSPAGHVRAAVRYFTEPEMRYWNHGFRPARTRRQ
jgi:formylglycine-generating enzyme required for sulfatase activity